MTNRDKARLQHQKPVTCPQCGKPATRHHNTKEAIDDCQHCGYSAEVKNYAPQQYKKLLY